MKCSWIGTFEITIELDFGISEEDLSNLVSMIILLNNIVSELLLCNVREESLFTIISSWIVDGLWETAKRKLRK